METLIVGILSGFGGIGIAIYAMLKYYNNIRNILCDLTSTCARIFGWFKSTSTKLSIESNGTYSINELNRIVPELNLPDLSIEWVKSDEHGRVILEPGKAIVLLKYDRDNTQNIINTTASYVQQTLLLNTKPFLDDGIKKALDFAVIRSFLNNTKQKDYVVTKYVDSCREDIDTYGDSFEKVTRVEDEGLLTRLLLREYAVLGNKLAGHTRNAEITTETKSFLDFVHNIAIREFDEQTPLSFNERKMKVAVLLVAKLETYTEAGIEPYVRRIREGFANGINTFYLLARNDKIEILNNVYGQLISTGNYNLINGPEIYKDNNGRNNLCYCIEVKHDAELAKAYQTISQCISEEMTMEVSVTNVYKDELLCDFQGIPVKINRSEITDNSELHLRNYYISGMTVEVIPLKIVENGRIEASLLNTKSNPKNLVDNNFSVGSIVTAIVQNVDDDFVKLIVKDTSQECVAYRRNLTYSRFEFLHKLFPVGNEYEFKIIDINYIYNCLELRLTSLSDPWDNCSLKVGDEIDCIVYNIRETSFETELQGGIYAIIPYSELSWFKNDIDKEKKRFKRNSSIKTIIKRINKENRLIILSCKSNDSPYITKFKQMEKQNQIPVSIESVDSYGYHGFVEGKYEVFIPNSETYIGENKFKVKVGKSYSVNIIDVGGRGDSFIGSFKPFIEHPLEKFKQKFSEGQALSHLTVNKHIDGGVFFEIVYNQNLKAEAFLPNSEISNSCYIKQLHLLFNNGFSCPLIIKRIDLERNQIILSLKKLTGENAQRLASLRYGTEYPGVVLGNNFSKYSVLLDNIWVEVEVESNTRYSIGDKVRVIKASSREFILSEDIQ